MTNHPGGEEPPAERKGRAPAILTYERVEDLHTKITHISAKLDYLYDRMIHRESEHKDHEVRIRDLETFRAGLSASATNSSDIWKWVWAAAVSVAMIGLQILNYLK